MKGKRLCKKCGKKVLYEHKAVLLMTFQGYKNLEKVYWHFQCYLDWINEELESRAMKLYSNSMKGAMEKFIPMLNNTINNGQEETNKDKVYHFRPS